LSILNNSGAYIVCGQPNQGCPQVFCGALQKKAQSVFKNIVFYIRIVWELNNGETKRGV
jgi:hypothetical protein